MLFFQMVTPDTIFVGLISIFTGVAIPLIRKYFKNICNKLDVHNDRLDLLEFIAISKEPELVEKYKMMKNES